MTSPEKRKKIFSKVIKKWRTGVTWKVSALSKIYNKRPFSSTSIITRMIYRQLIFSSDPNHDCSCCLQERGNSSDIIKGRCWYQTYTLIGQAVQYVYECFQPFGAWTLWQSLTDKLLAHTHNLDRRNIHKRDMSSQKQDVIPKNFVTIAKIHRIDKRLSGWRVRCLSLEDTNPPECCSLSITHLLCIYL